jgi:hypothetical protein
MATALPISAVSCPPSPTNSGTTATIALDLELQPGTYTIRWDTRDLQHGATNTEFFGLNNVSLNDSAVPEPASLLLVAAGGLALLCRRLRRAD